MSDQTTIVSASVWSVLCHFLKGPLRSLPLLCAFCAWLDFPAIAQQFSDDKGIIASKDTEGWQWRMFTFHPRFSVSSVYDDNINLSSTNRGTDVVWYLRPGISATVGEILANEGASMLLDYSPSGNIFTRHQELDAVNQSVNFRFLYPFSKLTLTIDSDYDMASTPIPEAGRRVERRTLGTGFRAQYQLSAKTSLDMDFHYHDTGYDDPTLFGSSVWVNKNSIDYELTSKLKLGIGETIGGTQPEGSASQTHEQILVHFGYAVAAKLDLSLSVGQEWRQGVAASGDSTPVFTLGARYNPLSETTVSLSASRSEQSSPTARNENYTSTSFSLSVQQTVRRVNVSLSGSYSFSDYHSNVGASVLNHADNYYSIRLGLGTRFGQHWSGESYVIHSSRTSNSSLRGITFDNNQVGIQATYSF